MIRLAVDPNPCLLSTGGCTDNYTGGHVCKRDGGHDGRCRCVCGATYTTPSNGRPS